MGACAKRGEWGGGRWEVRESELFFFQFSILNTYISIYVQTIK